MEYKTGYFISFLKCGPNFAEHAITPVKWQLAVHLTAQLAALTASRQAESLLNREGDVSEVDKDAKEPEQNSRTQDPPLGATSQM